MARNKRGYISEFYQYPLSGGPFVYYQSLLSKPSYGAKLVARSAQKYLFGASNILNKENYHQRINQALNILKANADEEARKEALYMAALAKKLDKYGVTDLPDITEDPYGFIIKLNEFLRGAEQFKQELLKETERIHTYRTAINRYGSAKEIAKVIKNGGDEDFTSEQLADTLHNISNTIEGRKGQSSSFTTYSSSIRDNSLAGKIAEAVINRLIQLHGSKLIQVNGNQFILNGRQAYAITTLIVNEIERKIMTSGGQITQKTIDNIKKSIFDKNDSSSIKQYDDIINKYMEASEFHAESLNSFTDAVVNNDKYEKMLGPKGKYGRGILNKRIRPLKELISEQKVSEQEKKDMNIALEQFSREWAAAAYAAQPKVYFTAEVDLGTLLEKHGEVLFSGGYAKDDIGSIVVSYEFGDDKKTNQALSHLETKIKQINRNAMKSMRYKEGTANEFLNNALYILESLEEMEQAYEETAAELEMSIEELKELVHTFTIHGNVKSYDTIDAKTGAFSGGSIGKNITEQLTNFANLISIAGFGGGYTDYDQEWLLTAIINTGEGLLGRGNKEGLEKYLSAFAGMLLFDDAYLTINAGTNQLVNSLGGTTVDKIHLYSLNGTIVPCSFVLYETYKNLTKELAVIGNDFSGEHGIKVTIKARGAIGGPFTKPEDWAAERDAAIAAADIQVQFMGHFLGFLDNLVHAMNPS